MIFQITLKQHQVGKKKDISPFILPEVSYQGCQLVTNESKRKHATGLNLFKSIS